MQTGSKNKVGTEQMQNVCASRGVFTGCGAAFVP